MIEAIELSKTFGVVEAVKKVSFVVNPGEAVGFLGPNGAGKTTTFRMIAGTIGASSGQVKLFGTELEADPIGAKRKLGYMPENAPLYPELTVNEYLAYRAELKGLRRGDRLQALTEAAEQTQVSHMLQTRIAHLSKGYRQRVALADAVLGSPPVLLLDEPTAGLDPNQVLEVRKLIRELAKEHAILLSTHILSEVEATCSRAIVINKGQVVAMGSLDELRTQGKGKTIRVVVNGDTSRLDAALAKQFDYVRVAPGGDTAVSDELPHELEVQLKPSQDLDAALRALQSEDFKVLEAGPKRAPLDDIFQALTQGSSQETTAVHSRRGE